MNKIIDNHPEIAEWVNIEDVRKVCSQSTFVVESLYYTYWIKGTQMTGRMNTSCGNSLRSYFYVRFSQRKAGIDDEDIRFQVMGDDQIICLSQNDVKKYEESAMKWVYTDQEEGTHGLGQIAKIFDEYPDWTGAEFLSQYVIEDNGRICMIRKPDRFLQSTPYTYKCEQVDRVKEQRELNELAVADALGVMAQPNLKFFRKYAEAMLRVAGIPKSEYTRIVEKYPNNVSYNDKTDTRDCSWAENEFEKFMWEKYGIDKSQMDEYYLTLANIKPFETVQINLIDSIYSSIKSVGEFKEIFDKADKGKMKTFTFLNANNANRINLQRFHTEASDKDNDILSLQTSEQLLQYLNATHPIIGQKSVRRKTKPLEAIVESAMENEDNSLDNLVLAHPEIFN